MKKTFLFLLLLAMTLSAICQPAEKRTLFNFDFEIAANGAAAGWSHFGDTTYSVSLDSLHAKDGKYAAVIEFNEGKPGFKAWGITIPSYPGKKITLSGYIKTENVTDGYAGLWMRIDPQIAFDNMQQRGITGTSDWTKYEVILDMNAEKTEQIALGGLLVGKGKMWIDGLTVSVDGQDIAALKPIEMKRVPAELDKEFDNGSGISLPTLDQKRTENLKVLGLVWGFLKYYHPNIAKGDFNWDYELFRVMPAIVSAETTRQRDDALTAWINRLGAFEMRPQQRPDAPVKMEPDLEWITSSVFSDTLTSLLLRVKDAARTAEHFYIGMHPIVGNPDFKNENAYPRMRPEDDGMRMLALFRYWNMIQYFFPYKNLIEEDWKNVLEEFVPKFAVVKDSTTYTLALLELIARIHDTHANIWGAPALNTYFGARYAPVELTFVEEKAMVSGYLHPEWGKETGLEVGDVIATIGGMPVEDFIAERLQVAPASNYPTQLRNMASNLLRTNDSTIAIGFMRDGQTHRAELKTFGASTLKFNNKFIVQDTSFKLLTDDIAYINNGSLNTKYVPGFWDKIRQTKGLIIDIRNYPSHFPIHVFSSYLMPKPTPFVVFSGGDVQHPGLFTLGPPMSVGTDGGNRYDGKVVILVNEISQSQAEFHAMAYRAHPNATVIGSTTAGADGNVSPIMLPGGIRTGISGIGVYYPDGGETQRVGIVPDIEVKPTIEGIKAGRDEVLEKAIETINLVRQ
ncbi:S41 family peptidase [Parapedobacter sp. DT-150]